MALKAIFWVALLALLGSIMWRYVEPGAFNDWLKGRGATPKPFVFDNGTVREIPSRPSPDVPISAPQLAKAIRKCQRGAEMIYTDNPCQQGFSDQPISNGSVTAVEAGPRADFPDGAAPASRRPVLREFRNESGGLSLTQKHIDHLVGR